MSIAKFCKTWISGCGKITLYLKYLPLSWLNFHFISGFNYPFSVVLSHTDMNDVEKSAYKLGDFIKFDMVFQKDLLDTKARLQECWATSDGSIANKYILIKDRFD